MAIEPTGRRPNGISSFPVINYSDGLYENRSRSLDRTSFEKWIKHYDVVREHSPTGSERARYRRQSAKTNVIAMVLEKISECEDIYRRVGMANLRLYGGDMEELDNAEMEVVQIH